MLHDVLGHRNGNGKTDILCALCLTQVTGIDANDFAEVVNQRTAAIAGIDGSIGLDEILVKNRPQIIAAGCADNTHGHGMAQSKGIADGQYHIAYSHGAIFCQRCSRQTVEVNFKHCQVRFRVAANYLRCCKAAIPQTHSDILNTIDHVIVCQDITIFAYQYTRAHILAFARYIRAAQYLL